MLARVTTFSIHGLEPRRITVEVDVRQGLPAFTIVGLGDQAVRESRERVRAAVQNCGFEFPARRVTVNLAPAYLRKAGPGFDLAIACAVLAASGQLPPAAVEETAVFGELGLSGELRPSRGALAVAEGARQHCLTRLLVPSALVPEAALVSEIAVHGARSLADVVAVLRGEGASASEPDQEPPARETPPATVGDLSDVRGHAHAIRALTIAAAGGHNLLLSGPPGTGKTMLACRLPSILPPPTREEALEITRISSVAGRQAGSGLATVRPFRAPHHGISAAGLVGGGAVPMPGEATLAHHGVLFL
jgi:magnesium chelatase family protein